jgi:hypothetical protein
MMNKSLRARGRESSRKAFYGFQRGDGHTQKKSRRFRRLLKLITGRRQTEWTGATRCPNEDNPSHNWESLINRKRGISFRLYLPCRPLAELGAPRFLNGSSRPPSRDPYSAADLMKEGVQRRARARGRRVWVPARALLGRDDGYLRLEKARGGVLRRALPAIAACSRSISELISAMRSASSSTDSSDRSCPISWVTFFLGLSSSSMAMRASPGSAVGETVASRSAAG